MSIGYGRRRAPAMLFHYTTSAGLLGILSSQSIWASDVRQGNDEREFLYTLDLMRSQLLSYKGMPGARELVEATDRVATRPALVASFSEDADLLSQWRAYANPNGFALGFRGRGLYDTVDYKTGCIAVERCVYNRRTQVALVQHLAKRALDFAAKGGKKHLAGLEKWLNVTFTYALAALASRLKDQAFQAEREWRVVWNTFADIDNRLQFRCVAGAVVPFVAVNLAGSWPTSSPVRVVVGPGWTSPHAHSVVSLLLAQQKLRKVKILQSKVPLRTR